MGPKFFQMAKRGGQNFFRGQRGGPNFFPRGGANFFIHKWGFILRGAKFFYPEPKGGSVFLKRRPRGGPEFFVACQRGGGPEKIDDP